MPPRSPRRTYAAPPDLGDAARRLAKLSSELTPPPGTTVMVTGMDGMPLATTSSVLSPVSMSVGTSNQVETMAEPVATPIVLKL